MRFPNYDILQGVPASLAGSYASPALFIGAVPIFNIQLAFTGTLAGTFSLEGSNDYLPVGKGGYVPADVVPTNWSHIIDSDQVVSAAGLHMWNAAGMGMNWVRVVWTPVSGSGTLTVAQVIIKVAL